MCPCTVSHDPGERPPGARRSTSTSRPAAPGRSTYASMKPTRMSWLTRPLSPPAQHCLQPRRQRARPERLREEVVGTQLEHPHLVVFVALRRENDDRDVGGRGTRTQVGQHAVAVEPGHDGYGVLSHLRSRPATADIPVIVLTAKSDEDNEVRVFELGADDFLTKPFRARALSARLEAVLGRRR